MARPAVLLPARAPGEVLFRPVRRQRLYEDIVGQIQTLIADRHLRPGDRLPGERELADALSVSRASVREALRVLDYIGVVEVRAGEGTFVASTPPRPLDPSVYRLLSERTFLLDVLEAREIVETMVVRLAAARIDGEDLAALERALERREAELAAGRDDVAGDLRFHEALADATGNPALVSVVRHLNELWARSRERTGRQPASPRQAHAYHARILQALRRRQVAAAVRAMREHLADMRRDLEAGLGMGRRPARRAPEGRGRGERTRPVPAPGRGEG